MVGDDNLPPDDSDQQDGGALGGTEEEGDGAGNGGELLQFPGLAESVGDGYDEDAYSTEELAALSSDPIPLPGDDPVLALSAEPDSGLEDFTEEHYVQSTTREYQGLAESIAEAATQEHEQSAVSAPMPGVDQGVLGFEDMTGEDDEHDAEALHEIEKAQRTDLFLRVGTGLALVTVIFGALNAGPGWITLFLGALVLVAMNEFYQAVRSVGYSPVGLFGLIGAFAVMAASWSSGPFAGGGVLAAVMLASSLWYAVIPRRYPLANAAITVLGVAWIALLASFAIPIFQAGEAIALITALVVLTALNDAGAFFTGRAMGSRKLAPTLSPNKTVEGFAGGLVICVLVGAGMGEISFFEPLTIQSGVALGVVVSLLGPLGDLSESLIKRLLGIKDMGHILPGHGGVLDRIDAFLFTIPAAYLLFRWYEYL